MCRQTQQPQIGLHVTVYGNNESPPRHNRLCSLNRCHTYLSAVNIKYQLVLDRISFRQQGRRHRNSRISGLVRCTEYEPYVHLSGCSPLRYVARTGHSISRGGGEVAAVKSTLSPGRQSGYIQCLCLQSSS